MWTELADMKVLNPDCEQIYKNYLEGEGGGSKKQYSSSQPSAISL